MKKLLLLICISFCALSFTIYQTNFLNLIEKKLNDYSKNHYPEKVYIQTDKPFYALDDDLWFTSYLVNGITHQKTNKSNILHVELINPKDSIVAKRTLFVENISVAGDFKIENNWATGKYLLRGYTTYMKNHGIENFFQKEIPIYRVTKDSIVNTDTVVTSTNIKKINKPEISFYPEGGYLINNLTNRVVFKIKTPSFYNNFKAVLKDKSGKEIKQIESIEYGLGNFIFKPEANNSYYISTIVNEKEYKYQLPKALNKGYVLSVTNTANSIIINAKSTTENGLKDTYLVAHERGTLLFNKYEKTNKKSYIVSIPSNSLVDGVVNITLFDNDGHPVAERAVFVNNTEDKLELNIQTNKSTYDSRKKITLNLNVRNKQGISVPSTLSMSVRDLKAYPYNTRTANIKTYLLLNSDLRGTIEDPNYFFEKENDSKRKYLLDLVMMTHGWKRFTWQELLNSKDSIQKYKPEEGLFISGTIKKLKKPYTPHKGPVRLTFLGEMFAQVPTKISDSLGHFQFGPYGFLDTIPMLLESRLNNFNNKEASSRNVVILLDKPKASPKINRTQNSTELSSKIKEKENFVKVTQYIKQLKFEYNQEVQKLKAVELIAKKETEESKRNEEMNRRTSYGSVGLGGSKRLDINSLDKVGSLSAYQLLMRLGGIYFSQGNLFLIRTQSQPQILLDGMEIDADLLRSINSDEISFIDILVGADANLVTVGGGNGVIAIYSKSGNEGSKNIKRKPGIINFDAVGFYTARKFYAPDHINGFEELNKKDVRTTLHWEPIIKIFDQEDTEISFFTSDIKSDYIIEVEGISANGQPIHAIKTFNVE
ncbi:Plug domain-containing protein [Wenyingzhuangia sp. chi5]|uniref:Plug domain-containing protein n=1 Tax=Wenyingzhuangia gilva TaxID=3057677 RepID=A0ABT8VS23_9FLAO|nr:Plug domain-containing protein [Wenyingzhuangia sp. chi5]MDO3694773.1 Plug domain-containing protein [Wenyingzhuangia sp. chi5]